MDCLFIAVKGVDPIDVLERTWHFLRLASTVLIYSPICEVSFLKFSICPVQFFTYKYYSSVAFDYEVTKSRDMISYLWNS